MQLSIKSRLAGLAVLVALASLTFGTPHSVSADEYEWDPTYGYHEEEWYDPSDWFDPDDGVDYEADYYGDYYDDYDDDYVYGEDDVTWYGDNYYSDDWYEDDADFDSWYESDDAIDEPVGIEEYNE